MRDFEASFLCGCLSLRGTQDGVRKNAPVTDTMTMQLHQRQNKLVNDAHERVWGQKLAVVLGLNLIDEVVQCRRVMKKQMCGGR